MVKMQDKEVVTHIVDYSMYSKLPTISNTGDWGISVSQNRVSSRTQYAWSDESFIKYRQRYMQVERFNLSQRDKSDNTEAIPKSLESNTSYLVQGLIYVL